MPSRNGWKKSFSCSNLSVPNCRATRRKHEGWDTARLPKPRQGKSRGRGRVRTTDLPINLGILVGGLSYKKTNVCLIRAATTWNNLLVTLSTPYLAIRSTKIIRLESLLSSAETEFIRLYFSVEPGNKKEICKDVSTLCKNPKVRNCDKEWDALHKILPSSMLRIRKADFSIQQPKFHTDDITMLSVKDLTCPKN
ncbi:hypothetical protein CSKR_113737 [Clonorchis sinensis]|uniref:Uncharacterized protein n=1 Tax=Clonorchis sinensis TaxID=79923 RepID=A0A3R7F1P0_CLOSI|nr:hypothetical protein CSKR_113737 [Clonorchis sinensis]